MSPVDVKKPVRRSPLESIHAGLGAQWCAPDIRWPAHYGDPHGEMAAAHSASVLVDWGPLDKTVVQGTETAQALRGLGLQFDAGKLTVSGNGLAQAWGLAPDEAIVVRVAGSNVRAELAPLPSQSGPISARTAITDVSSGLAVLRLVGPVTRKIVAEACPADLSERAVADMQIVHAPVANVRVTMARHDFGRVSGAAGGPGQSGTGVLAFTLLVPRDYARYLWESLIHVGRPHGLRPAGVGVMGDSLMRVGVMEDM